MRLQGCSRVTRSNIRHFAIHFRKLTYGVVVSLSAIIFMKVFIKFDHPVQKLKWVKAINKRTNEQTKNTENTL